MINNAGFREQSLYSTAKYGALNHVLITSIFGALNHILITANYGALNHILITSIFGVLNHILITVKYGALNDVLIMAKYGALNHVLITVLQSSSYIPDAPFHRIDDISVEELKDLFDLNVVGYFLTSKVRRHLFLSLKQYAECQ